MEIQTIEIEYYLTEEEKVEKGREAAKKNNERKNVEAEKKAVMADYTAKVKVLSNELELMFETLNSGFEVREVEARLVKNYLTNEKEYYDPVTGDLVKKVPFEPKDLQRHLDEVVAPVDDVKAFESKSKAPKTEEAVNENGEPEAVKTEEQPEGYERLEYNEVLQKFHVDDVRFSRAGREQNEDWKIIAEKRADIITNFLWLFPEFRGSFADAKNEFDNYLIRLEETEALKEADAEKVAEETTEETGEETEDQTGEETSEEAEGETSEGTGQTEKKKRVRKKYVVKSKRNPSES